MIRVNDYKGKYRIVSLAFEECVKEDLQRENLDFIYIKNNKIVLYPEEIILTEKQRTIEKLMQASNYDVYELMEDGRLIEYYNDKSIDNYFFVSGKCNSNCIMCPSPDASRKNGKNANVDELIEIAKHIPSDTQHLTLTGGEPFIIGESIFEFLCFLRDKFDNTEFLILTNGRIFAIDTYVERLKRSMPYDCIVGIPIHGSCAEIHDGITQSKGSFAQTISGIKKLVRNKVRIEIRIVVSKLNGYDIENIAKMITKTIPNVLHVSIMAMEMTGSAYVNRNRIWLMYSNAAEKIENAVRILINSGIDVKIYNFPLCVVNKQFWTLCERSISPDKVRYAKQCEMCKMRPACGGVFAGTIRMEESELKAII